MLSMKISLAKECNEAVKKPHTIALHGELRDLPTAQVGRH